MKRPPYLPPLLIAVLLCTCAKQGMPPGGPVDKTPPEITQTVPASGSVGTSPDVTVAISFSEPMNRTSVEKAVFISPRLPELPSFSWKKNTLRIRPSGRLTVPATYTVTVGAEAADLRGNRLVTSFSLALATGDSIASGEISGSVFNREGMPQNVLVGAYVLGDSVAPDLFNRPPAYLTQADAEGRYRLPYLNDGIYRLLAYMDKNADGTFTPGRDMPGVAVSDPVLQNGGICRQADLVLAPFDTTRPEITAVQPVTRTRLQVRFCGALDRTATGKALVAVSGDAGDAAVRALFPADDSDKKMTVICDPLVSGREYTLTFRGLANVSGMPLDDTLTARFTAAVDADTVGPGLAAFTPADSSVPVLPDEAIVCRFTEAVDTARMPALTVSGQDGTPVAWQPEWSSPLELAVRPHEPLSGSRHYTVQLDLSSCFDYAGNPGADSTVSFRFRTVPADTLGTVIGELTAAVPGSAVYVVVLTGTGRTKTTRQVSRSGPGAFRFDGLLPGTYRLFAFRDDNGNGHHDTGCPQPFIPAEPFRRLAQPVAVRAQWEVEGITVAF